MDNFNLDELMDLAEAYVGPMVDAIYRRLIERDFALEDPEVVMLLTALINILGHDNRGDRPTEVLLMAAYGERGVLDRPNMRVMRWRNGALSGSDLANEPGLGSSRTYQPGEMPMPSKPKPGLTRMHQEMNSEATSSGSPLRAAVPPKGAKVTQKVQTNQTIQDLDEMNDQLRSTKKELDDMTKTMLAMEEDRDMWRKLFEDCNKKQGQEIERLRQEYKERSEQVALTTSIEKVIPARDIPRGQSPMELLTPREMSQTTETRLPAETNRVTIPDPSDTLGDPVVEQTVRKLIETAGRLVANKNAPGSGVTAPYGTIDDTGRVQLSQTVIRQGMSNLTPLMGNSRIPERKVRKMPAKKVSRVIDVQKNNQLKYNFTGVPETDPRACFNRATWSPAVNLQQPPLGTSHLILGDSLVRVLSNLRTSWVTTVMAFGGATIAQLYRMMELMNPGKIPNVMILVGTNDISRGSDEQEALWEAMMVCLFTTLWQKFSCAVLTVCTVPMNTRSLTASGRRHNEGVMRWNNILRNLANRNAGRMILMDIEHELRAMDQARLTTDGIHFDSVEGQAWLNRVFQERLDELETELFDTGVLKEEGTVSDTVITTFVPPNLETRLGTVPAVISYRQQSSGEPGRRTDVQDRLGEAPMRRTIHPRKRIEPVNQPFENIKRELCEAPVLGMPTEKGMYVLDTDASVVAISGILHQEQEWNGRTVLRPIVYGSKALSDTEMKYGAPKAEMFAVVTFVEKYRAYLGSAPFKLRVDNRALSWLKTYSMDQSYIGRWIVRLDGYHMIIEHRMRDKHQNADSLSKKTEFYERLEQKQANQAEVKEGFSFLDKETYEALPLTRWLDNSGHPIPGHPELPVEKAAEIKILSKEDPVPLDLLLRSNLVQQELSRMNINSLSLLDKTVQVTPQVMRMLGGLLEREVTRDDPEWTAAVASLTISEKVKIMPSRRQHEENERDCRTIVQQLVSSIPQEILTSTSYGQKGQESGRQKKTVTFVDRDKDGEVVKQNLLQDYLSGEKDEEKNQRSQDQHPGQVNWSGESEIDEKIPDEKQDLENKVLSREFRWMRRKYRHDLEERAVSSTTPSTDNDSRNSGMDT